MVSHTSYHESVKASLKRRPGLQIVRDSISTYPNCYCFDVHVIHILRSGGIHPHTFPCRSQEDLKQAIGPLAPTDRASTIILAEDMTKTVVEALGSNFAIEPEFFAVHLREHDALRTGEWSYPTAPALDLLPSYLRDAPFYSIHFRRPCEFSAGYKEVVRIRKDPNRTHVSRPVRWSKGLPIVFAHERVSVYTKRDFDGVDYGRLAMSLLLCA